MFVRSASLLTIDGKLPRLSRSVDSRVIILADRADRKECLCVLVGTDRVKVVQGGGAGWVTITSREVYAHGEVDLTATEYILQERVTGSNLRGWM